MTSTSRGLLCVVVLVVIVDLSNALSQKVVECDGVKLIKMGCYKDDQKKPRPLPELMFTDRDVKDSRYSGVRINWKKWDIYMEGLICRCAWKALKKKYNLIGLQHYGGCWSGENSKTSNYPRSGPSSFCINGKAKKCSRGVDCVGEDNTNFIYRVVDDDPKPTPRPTQRPSTPRPTKPPTPKPTPPSTPATTPKRPTTPPQFPTTGGSGTSTARPKPQPTQAPAPCVSSVPAAMGCQQPVPQCLYPPCMQAPPVVPQMIPAVHPNANGCGKSGVPCPGKEKDHKLPSLDDSTEEDFDDDDDDDDDDRNSS